MEAIVLAGGFGTRLAHVVSDVPKPMAPVCNRPFLRFILDDLQAKGIERVVLAVGYKQEVIRDYFAHIIVECRLCIHLRIRHCLLAAQ